jgi:hypothetical protein
VPVKHFILPDIQAKPGIDFDYLEKYGEYVVDKKPDVIICLGDFVDMASLSSFDVGRRPSEGRRYHEDIKSSIEAMERFLGPLKRYNEMQVRNKKKPYKPRMVMTLGNHENRINRACDENAKLHGTLSVDDLRYEDFGWEVYPFLVPVVIDGVAYAHYFISGTKGLPISTAQALVSKMHMSCIAGHLQGKQIAMSKRADGTRFTCIIVGSAYEHFEDYLGPQGNQHWRGCLMLNEVHNGEFDEMFLSLDYLKNRHLKDY